MLFDDFPLLDNRRLYLPSLDDVAAVVKDFTITEITTLVGIVLWFLLMLVPLTGIDRRDGVTGSTFLLFACAAAVLLVIAVPGKLAHLQDAPWQAAAIVAFGMVAAIRWVRRPTGTLPKSPTSTEEKRP